MKFLFDIFPVILFFVAWSLYDIYVATATAMTATAAQILWAWLRHRKVDKMLWATFAIMMVFGSATLILRDPTFIKLKPTVLYWLFAGFLAVSALAFKKNMIRTMMEKQVSAPDSVWKKLLIAWIGFFTIMGIVNLYIAHMFSEAIWVKFKVFGGIGLMIVFVIGQAIVLAPHMKEKESE